MRFLAIITILFFNDLMAWHWLPDSASKHKDKKNCIEYGKTYTNLMDGNGFTSHKVYYQVNHNIAYTRVFKYGISAKIFYAGIVAGNNIFDNIPIKNHAKGDVMVVDFRTIKLELGKRFKYKNFIVMPTISANKRWGYGELMFWELTTYNEFYTDRNPMNSFGVGAGCNFGYSFFNRIILKCDLSYSYNYEKLHDVKYGHEPDFYTSGIKPNKEYLFLNINLGFLF